MKKSTPSNIIARTLRKTLKHIPVLATFLVVFWLGWWLGRPAAPTQDTGGSAEPSATWTCSMHPQIQQPGPGLCPICNMDLVPMNTSGGAGPRDVMVTTADAEALNMRISPVVRRPASRQINLVGTVTPDERSIAKVTARISGRIDRLFVDYTGISVKKGDHMAELYSPDLLVAQQELIQAKKSLRQGAGSPELRRSRDAIYRAAREKLRLLELSEHQIGDIEKQDTPSDRITLGAPQSGIVTLLAVREGEYVQTGQQLFSVADLSSVWVLLDAYEQDLPWLRFAQEVSFATEAAPGEIFTGRIAFIDPIVDAKTRTARVRVNVANPDGVLKPGMFVSARVSSTLAGNGFLLSPSLKGKWISPMHPEIIKNAPGKCDICGMDLVRAEELGFSFAPDNASSPLLVPASAVLQTGSRAVVYKKVKSGVEDHLTFEGTTVTLGARVGDDFIVESGLEAGDFVVTQGAFKLDSELQIQGKESMMSMPASYSGPPVPVNPLDPDRLAKLKTAITSYLALSGHLAHDRDAEASNAVPKLAANLRAIGVKPTSEAAAALVGKSGRKAIVQALPEITAALADIVRNRAADQMDIPLYLLHCPMALGDKGGDWIHTSEKIENPYFGSEMFACGEVKARLTTQSDEKDQPSHPRKQH